MSQTLYERLGGETAIAAVVDDFYERVLADERLAHFFAETDMEKQRAHQTQFLSAVAGGPVEYTGEDMAAVHARLEIDDADVDAIATRLEETLVAFDVDERDRADVLEAFESYREPVVSASD